jgi:hypothetical protein
MKTSSAKAKGRAAVAAVKALLHKYKPVLDLDDIVMPAGSQPGADIHLSPHAKRFYPFAIEVKCQESLNVWSALKQTESHLPKPPVGGSQSIMPLLFFKRNRTELYCALKAEDFVKLISNLPLECLGRSESPEHTD